MKLVLKPLFEVELPPEFVDILRAKLKGREIKEGETIEINLLGKNLAFKVLYAEPKELKVSEKTKVELASGEILKLNFEFGKPIKEIIPFEKGIVVMFEHEVLILSEEGHKIYNEIFEGLKEVRVAKNLIAVIHDGGKKLTLIYI